MIRDIQILRGLAVLCTILTHIPATYHAWHDLGWAGWWTGVDVFFAVSGYVIARSLFPRLEEASSQWREAGAFWIKRLYRLVPTAAFWASVLLLLALTFNKTGIFGPVQGVLWEYVGAMLYVDNFLSAHYSLGPYWSLSLEEQFYAVLPCLVILVPWLMRPKALALLIVLILAIMPFYEQALGNFRVAPLFGGVLVYQFSRTKLYMRLEPKYLLDSPARYGVLVGLFAVLVSTANQTWLPDRWVVLAAVPAVLVWLASYNKGYINVPGPIVPWIGDRSYSVYLIHMPMLLLTYEVLARMGLQSDWYAVPVAIAGTLLLAAASYRWIERPTQRLGQEQARKFLARHREPAPAGA